MPLAALPFNAPLAEYVRQADGLLAGWMAGNDWAINVFRSRHPRFLDSKVPWLERRMTDAEVRAVPIVRGDALLALARWYDFADWRRLMDFVEGVTQPGSPQARFEAAVEAVIDGDLATLSILLREDPGLVRARSSRVTHFDPPVHGAMLLHYLAANGVEGYRQRSPANAPAVARMLLDAGADPNATCSLYGGQCTTMALLVSSTHPAKAGVQVPLIHLLIDYGASIEPVGTGHWTSPLATAMVFDFMDAAQALVDRGATIATLSVAAGLGRTADVIRMLPSADAADRHRALALAALQGHAEIVVMLIDHGEDPNRYNPPGTHAHSAPLHQAIAADRLEVVKVLIARGARLDLRDTIYSATPLGWAEYCNKPTIAEYLRQQGAAR